MPGQLAALLAPLAEVMATSDLPKGAVNLLSGDVEELAPHFASHMEIQAMSLIGATDKKTIATVKMGAAENMKRVVEKAEPLSLHQLLGFVEAKTIWHPLGY